MNATLQAITGVQRERLRSDLRALGFDDVRFAAAARPVDGRLRAWLSAGMHADMDWIARSAEKRTDPRLVLDDARTVISLGINYRPSDGTEHKLATGGRTSPRWARYALHADYHDTVKAGLAAAGRILEDACGAEPADYRYYVDTGPVLERGWAARSGMGFRGKNGVLISRQHGNWLFLAAIITRLEVEPDPPLRPGLPRDAEEPAGLLCGKCTRCMDACPTAAITTPGLVDSRLCISYQTIENKGIIPRELREGIGNRVYGCDICLEVCPWNRFAAEGRRTLLAAREDLADLTLADLLALTPERYTGVFRRTAIKRLKLAGVLRNACIVAGNTGDPQYLPAVARLASHDAAIVRAHAVWAVRKIAGDAAARELLAGALRTETDPLVLAEWS
jgi:epoxyqueuosine reductase